MAHRLCPSHQHLLGMILIVFALIAATPAHALGNRNVLILNSYNWGFAWADLQVQGLVEELRNYEHDIAITIDQLDVIGRPDFDEERYADYLAWRLRDRTFDLIITTDNAALKFVAGRYRQMFQGVPVVFSDASEFKQIKIPPDMPITGVHEHIDFITTIDMARRIRPNARKITVFGNDVQNGTGPRTAQNFLSGLELDIPIEIILDRSLEETLELAKQTSPSDIVINLSYTMDRSKKFYGYLETAAEISAVSPAPLVDFWSIVVANKSGIGGKVSDPYDQGRTAGQLAIRVLSGEDPNTIPTLIAPTKYLFYYPQLVRHGIDLDILPEESKFLEFPDSVYDQYKEVIWGAVTLIIALIFVIITLLYAIRTHRNSEIALAAARDRLEEQVQYRTKELTQTNDSLKSTLDTLNQTQEQLVESEKMAALGGLVSGVAHEINTPLGVSLTAASHLEEHTDTVLDDYNNGKMSKSQFEKFLNTAKEITDVLMHNLDRAAQLVKDFKQVAVDQSTDDIREIELYDYLQTTIGSLAPEMKQGRHHVEITCPTDLRLETQPGALAQVLTNFITNSVRHGFGKSIQNGQIEIVAQQTEKGVQITYQDNGKGMPEKTLKHAFDPFFTTARNEGGSGLGLSIVFNIVTHKLGGTIQCDSHPGEGVKFTLSIPTER